MALRVAANGALGFGPDGACERTQRSLTIAPAVAQSFELESADGKPICSVGTPGGMDELEIVPPSDIRVRIAPDASAVALRVGVVNGMATAIIGVRNSAPPHSKPGDESTRSSSGTAPASFA